MAKDRRRNIVVAVALDERQRDYLDVGKRTLGTRSAVIRAVLDQALAAGLTFGARITRDVARKGGAV